MKSRDAWFGIALNPELYRLCRRLDDARARSLYSSTSAGVARVLGVDKAGADRVRRILCTLDLEDERRRLKEQSISFVTRADKDYPEALREIYDPPAALFYRGKLDLDSAAEARIAMVGSRRATAYGCSIAREWALELAVAGVVVVSGLARGIDAAAHRGALEGGRTIAVLGSGLNRMYPPEHRRLARDIAREGAVVTEYPPDTPPRPLNFPARNRIISGLSRGVVIVEASARSGALITADFALEQGREVLAVPGAVRGRAAEGGNRLLKQGAGVATGVEDILAALDWDAPIVATASRDAVGRDLSASQTALLLDMPFEPTRIDALLSGDDRRPEQILADLTDLEIKGYIAKRMGGLYCRIR